MINKIPFWIKAISCGVIFLVALWVSCFSYTNNHSISIQQNIFTGEMSILNRGFRMSPPWVLSSNIDIRPFRSCVECSCRNITCNLVSFNKDGWKDFVSREGFRYYWWSNRLSINMGHKEEYRGIKNILRGYSFDDIRYEFLMKNSSI